MNTNDTGVPETITEVRGLQHVSFLQRNYTAFLQGLKAAEIYR